METHDTASSMTPQGIKLPFPLYIQPGERGGRDGINNDNVTELTERGYATVCNARDGAWQEKAERCMSRVV